ncbi:YhgE/Pip domain-containing protein [Evansella halocellulosilytica]|uniref:YhgE/Pip domain-containing protein n=1 Tax=Evansella halocellulosilytica TaxID=2011013 RepID=UPI000BB91E6D|nr:YhgE/Pip domain-containing protein [Evansella halocellulosilytica]
MKNAGKIFIQDLKNIKRVPLVGILLIGLAILPSLYAWFNLSASWDPYANTQGVQVAVVNEDVGTEIDGHQVNIGEELVENLMENENLGWQFVDRQQAEQGVKYGDYYASIFISSSFSEDLASVIEGEPISSEVHYQVNEKINAIAPKMTSAGATTIVKEINDQFVEETSKALFQEFDHIGLQLEEELPTIRHMKQVVFELEERFPQINEFAEMVIHIDDNWDQVDERVQQFLDLEELIPQVRDGANQILYLESHMSDINELGEGVLELEQAIPEIEAAAEEMGRINEHFSQIAEMLEEALEGAISAQETIQAAQDILPAIEERTASAEEYMEALMIFIDEAEGAADPVLQSVTQQVLFANQAAAAADEVLSLLEDEATHEEAAESLKRIDTQLASHVRMLENAIEMYTILYEHSGDDQLLTVIDQLTRAKDNLELLQSELNVLVQSLEAGETLGSEQVTALRERAQAAERATNELYHFLHGEGSEIISSALDALEAELEDAGGSMADTYESLQAIEDVLLNAEEIVGTGEETIRELIDRFPEIEDRIDELVMRVQDDLPTVIQTIERAADFIRDDLPGIEERVSTVADFIREDLPQIEEEYGRLSDLLEENLPEIEQSVRDLAQFAREQMPEIEENLGDAADRIRELEEEDRLNELIAVLRNDLDQESEFFASPVNLIEEELYPIPNYGSANAPFYTVLSLWVGALLLSNLITTNVHAADRRPEYTLRDIYLGRMILFLIVGILQGLIVSIGNLLLLGVYAANPLLFILFTVIVSIVFMTIVYTLASLLGNIGKALAIVLLVLQLSGAGGTFPIEVAPPFFQAINPYLPFTYAINLLREAVGGVIPSLAWINIFVLLGFWLVAIALGLLLKAKLSARIEETAEKSKSSRLVE